LSILKIRHISLALRGWASRPAWGILAATLYTIILHAAILTDHKITHIIITDVICNYQVFNVSPVNISGTAQQGGGGMLREFFPYITAPYKGRAGLLGPAAVFTYYLTIR
jgi:hypothetical protein